MALRPAGVGLSLLLSLLALISGCGGAETEGSSSEKAKELLVTVDELPPGAKIAKPFPEPCTPIPVLEEGKTEVDVTKPLEFESVVMREALGIFPDEDSATAAYEELTSPERAECIAGSIEELGSGESVEAEPPTSFDVAEEDSDQKFRSIGPGGSTSGVVDVVSLKSGACVATLIFISEGEAPSGVQEVSEAAAGHLPDDC